MRTRIYQLGMLLAACLFYTSTLAQNASVSGKVLNQSNEPLIGALIKVIGQSAGAYTASDGSYSIGLPAGTHVLSTSYLGHVSKLDTISLNTGQNLNFNIKLKIKYKGSFHTIDLVFKILYLPIV